MSSEIEWGHEIVQEERQQQEVVEWRQSSGSSACTGERYGHGKI
jgi:hypothetical protein